MFFGQSVLLRGIRWRLGGSILMTLAATLAFAAATLAPLYLRAAEDSVVRSRVSAAPVPSAGVKLAGGVRPATLGQVQAAERRLVDAGGVHRWFGQPITTVQAGASASAPDGTPFLGALYNRTGICAHLVMRVGPCRLSSGMVLLSDRTAAVLGVTVGDQLGLGVNGRQPLRVRVSGIYAEPNFADPYWWGDGPDIFAYGAAEGPRRIGLDPFMTTVATALGVPPADNPAVSGQIPLFQSRVDLSNEHRFLQDLGAATTAVGRQGHVVVSTDAPAVLAAAAHERHVMSTIVVTVAVQLLVLAMWVLSGLVIRSGEARQAEIRLARLRGFAWPSVLGVIAAEPAALCVVALPLGFALAWVTVAVTRGAVFSAGTAIVPSGWLWVSMAATVAGIAVALGVAAARVYRATAPGRPELSRRGSLAGGWRTRAGAIGDGALVVLCIAALVELSTSGAFTSSRSDPLAAAGPGLVALGVAVVGVQLVLIAARLLARWTAGSTRLATFLAVRQVARRPVLLRQGRVLVVALCLASFATAAWWVARANRNRVALFGVGAQQVVTVVPPAGVDPETLVDRVDPAGRYAMAAAVVTTNSSTLLAVDSSRLARVAAWPAGVSPRSAAQVAAALAPHTAPVVTVAGQGLGVHADVEGSAVAPAAGRVDLEGWVYNATTSTTDVVDFGPVRAGSAAYATTLGTDCLSPCRLSGLGLVPTPSTSPEVLAGGQTRLVVTAVRDQDASGRWHRVAADLTGDGWSAIGSGVRVSAGADGPVVAVSAPALAAFGAGVTSQSAPMAGPADAPTTLPAAVTNTVASLNGGGAPGTSVPVPGLDGATLTVSPVATARVLPRVGSNATLVDLELLQRSQTATTLPTVSYQVWLGAGAPADTVRRLRQAGFRVEAVDRASAAEHQLSTSGPALADDFLLVATAAALVVAALSTLAALTATARVRSRELAVLEVAGVGRRTLTRVVAGESLALVVTASFGVVAGVVAAAIAVPSLPELAAVPGFAPPLAYPLQVPLMLGVGAVVAGVVLAAGLLSTASVARRARTTLAREGFR